MDENNHIPEAKIKVFMVMGTIGIAVILIADFAYKLIHKGFEQIKMTGWF